MFGLVLAEPLASLRVTHGTSTSAHKDIRPASEIEISEFF